MYKETSWTFKNDRERLEVLEGRYRRGKKKNVFATLSGEKKKKSSVGQSMKNFFSSSV